MKQKEQCAIGSNGNAVEQYTLHAPQSSSAAPATDRPLTAEEKLIAAVEQANAETDEPNAADPQSLRLLNLFTSAQVLPTEEIETTNYLFRWGNVDFMPRQNVVSLKAPAKTGKTFALTAFACAYLMGEYYGLRSYADGNERILFVDTEQARNDTRKVLKRITKCAGADRIDVFNLRSIAASERLPLIEMACDKYKPGLIIIDGIADLIPGMDYNDQEKADEAVARLSAIAEGYNAVVLTAIHTNKGNASEATGWLGRILLQKCAVEMGLSRKAGADTRVIEFVTRDREVDPIPVCIENTDDNLGQIRLVSPTEVAVKESDLKRDKGKAWLMALGIEPPLRTDRPTLTQRVIAAADISKDAARKRIDRYIADGVLQVKDNAIIFE